MSTATATDIASGPLRLDVLGPAPDARHGRALDRLRGHGSSDQLIPAGLFDQLDEARQAHLAARAHLARRIQAVIDQARLFAAEDRARQADIEAAAAKLQDSPPDERTPRDERQETAALLYAEAWAAVIPLADRLNDVVATCREHEKAWLSDLRAQLPVLNAKRAEAERMLAAAELEERKLASVGTWLQRFADDDGAFAISPLVVPETIPPGARGHVPVEACLSRPYHRGRDWNEGEGAPERPTKPMTGNPQRQPEPPDEDAEPGVREMGGGVGVVFG